jgi:hypothetical protein
VRRGEADAVEPALGLEVDPRRRAAHDAMDVRQVLARAELLARAAEEHDDVALPLPPRGQGVVDVVEEADHGDGGRGRMLTPSVSL